MTLNTTIETGFSQVSCDICGESERTPTTTSRKMVQEREAMQKRLAEAGWRCYRGRTSRHYCPRCKPSRNKAWAKNPQKLIWGVER